MKFLVMTLALVLCLLPLSAQAPLTPDQQNAATKVYQAWSGAKSMIELIEAKDPTGLEYGKNVVGQIPPAIEAAEKAGVPADYPITYPGSDDKITIAELKKNLPIWLGESTAAADKVKEEQDAKLAPHRNKLSGDRLRIFNEVFTLNLKCYGEGGKLLNTPEEYAAAKIWASVGHPPGFVDPHWDIGIWHWNGMALEKKTTDQGVGDHPPSSAFK